MDKGLMAGTARDRHEGPDRPLRPRADGLRRHRLARMRMPNPADPSALPGERPGVALVVVVALFAVWYGTVSLGLAWWDRVQEGQWAAVRHTEPLVDGQGHWQSGNWRMHLIMAPAPFISQRTVRVTVTLRHAGRALPGQKLAMRLKMPSMPSFDLALRLHAQGNGVYTGALALPLCTGRPTPAVLQVRCDANGRSLGTGFRFDVLPPEGRGAWPARP
jgi:hypothetical protein